MEDVSCRSLLLSLCLVSALLAVGCSAPPQSTFSIVGGDVVVESDPMARNIVALTQTNGRILCSGVLLGPGVVLTAAHCLPSLRSMWKPTISFSLQGELSWLSEEGRLNPLVRRIVRVSYHAGFSFDAMDDVPVMPPHDVGLVFYEGDTPAGYSRGEFSGETVSVGTSLVALGYGVVGTEDGQSGPLRRVVVAASKWHKDAKIVQIGPQQGRGACYGDSGGPLAVQNATGTWTVAALISYGPEEGESGPNCESGRFYATDIAAYRAWIETNSGYDLLSGARRAVEAQDVTSFRL